MGISQAVTTLPCGWLTRAAFDTLVIQFQAPIQRFLYGLVHDPELAADLCQDTFLSAYKAAPSIKKELNVQAWLYTIALNHARGHLRRKRLLNWVPFTTQRHDRPGATIDVATQLAQHEQLRDLLKQLPVQQRACLLLHAEGFRYAEIAQILNCSEGAVKLRIFRARQRCLEITAGREDE